MSLPEIAAAVASGTAVALATEATLGRWEWAKRKVRELMHRGTVAEQNHAVAVFDDQDVTAEELAARVTPFLRAHLDAYPMAANEFKTLAAESTIIYNQSNTGTGVFIGGDNHGGLTINHGGPAA